MEAIREAKENDFSLAEREVERVCEKHGPYKTTVFAKISGVMIGGRCSECDKERIAKIKREAENIQKQLFIKRKEMLLIASCIPPVLKEASIDSVFKDQVPIRDAIVKWIRIVKDKSVIKKPSMMFLGAIGTGKTYMACATLNHLINEGHSCIYTKMQGIFNQIKDSYAKGADQAEAKAFRDKCANSDLLVVDEIFGPLSEHDTRIFFDIIDDRNLKGLPTLIISNCDKDQVEGILGKKTYDRIKDGSSRICIFKGKSYRG